MPKKVESISGFRAALEILEREGGGPMKVKDLAEAVLRDKRVKGLKGKTPIATLSAQFYTSCKKPDGALEKVGPGEVQMRNRPARPPKKATARKRAPRKR